MVKTEISRFMMQRKGMLCTGSQKMFGIATKQFKPVDMFMVTEKFILAVINSEMSIAANINKPIVAYHPFVWLNLLLVIMAFRMVWVALETIYL